MEFAQHWALEMHLTGAQRELQEVLLQGQGYAVCDSSFKDGNRAAAWIIEGTNLRTRLSGQWYTPGHVDDHSSFCSKLAGIVRVLYTLTFWPPKKIKPMLCIACNSLSVISRLLAQQLVNPTEPHADLLAAACMLMQSSDYKVDLAFVQGHQDTGQAMALTRDVWLNIEADLLAKNKATTPYTGPLIYKLPGNAWGCYMGKKSGETIYFYSMKLC